MLEHSLLPESPFHSRLREFEDCVIALHDALKMVGDCEGRELLDCVLRRFERAVSDSRREDGSDRRGAEEAEEEAERGIE